MLNLSWFFTSRISPDSLCSSESAVEDDGKQLFEYDAEHHQTPEEIAGWSDMLDGLISSVDHKKCCAHCEKNFAPKEKRIRKKSTGQYFHEACLHHHRGVASPSMDSKRGRTWRGPRPPTRRFYPHNHIMSRHSRCEEISDSADGLLHRRVPMWRFQHAPKEQQGEPAENRLLAKFRAENKSSIFNRIVRRPFKNHKRRKENRNEHTQSESRPIVNTSRSRGMQAFLRRQTFTRKQPHTALSDSAIDNDSITDQATTPTIRRWKAPRRRGVARQQQVADRYSPIDTIV